MTVKTGTAEEFFKEIRTIMRAADKGLTLEESKTITFEEPTEMLHFLSKAKIHLLRHIRQHSDSITNIAKALNRHRAAVYRDINELEQFGLVKTHEEINPGHGRHRIVEMAATNLKLEAYL